MYRRSHQPDLPTRNLSLSRLYLSVSRYAVLQHLLVETTPADRYGDSLNFVALQMAALPRANRMPLTQPENALTLHWLDAISSIAAIPSPTRSTNRTQSQHVHVPEADGEFTRQRSAASSAV